MDESIFHIAADDRDPCAGRLRPRDGARTSAARSWLVSAEVAVGEEKRDEDPIRRQLALLIARRLVNGDTSQGGANV